MLLFLGCVIVACLIVTLPWSIVSAFLKSTKTGQKIAIGVSLWALLILIFLPLAEALLFQFNGLTVIKALHDNSFREILELFGGSELFPILLAVLLIAPIISMGISSFYKNGGVIGGILMLCAAIWLVYELSEMPLFKIGVGTYLYALCAVFTCFTPLFNGKKVSE